VPRAPGAAEVEARSIREPGGSQRNSGKLSFFFKLTRIGCMMSWSTMAIASCSSLSTAATHEHGCSVLFSTYPQLAGKDFDPGEPKNPSPATPGSTTPKNPGDGTVQPEAVHLGMLGPELCTTKSNHGPPIASSG
jgi:hypothetical protein